MTDATDRLAGLPADKRRLLEMRLRMAREAVSGADPQAPRPRPRPDGTAPLSFAQQRQWVLEQMQPGTPAWNVSASQRLRGPLDVPALERALDALRRRHESLRTTFSQRGGQPVQVIHPFAPVPLPVEDLSSLGPAAREAEAERRATADLDTGFDLAAGPLFRARLLRLAADDHVLLACMHHVVSDGWSVGVIGRELAALYGAFAAGRPDPLPAPALQYADFAAWQREWLSGERLAGEVEFWRRTLAGAPPALELPLDHPRPPVQAHRGARVSVDLPPAAAGRLRALAREENATLFAVLLAALRVVLARWSGQGDVVIGTAVAGRTRVETEGLVGLFVNTLALRAPVAGDPAFRQQLRRERDAALDAFSHQELPFERVVEELKAPRDPSRTPVFQVMLSLHAAGAEPAGLPGLESEPPLAEIQSSKFDLVFEAFDFGGGLTIALDYDVALFEAATAQALVDHLAHVLGGAAERPDAPISALAEPLPAALPREVPARADRPASPAGGDAAPARHEPPSNADEELLAAIWADVLGVERVGAGDDFFDRGGQSLLATQVAGRIRQVFGVELPLGAVFEAPVLRDQARRISALRGGSGAPETSIPRADRAAPLPLSFAQERLWFIGQMLPESAAYNVPLALELLGPVDAAALERAVGEVVRRHEALRTVIVQEGGGAVQRVEPFTGFHLPVSDLTAWPGDRQDEAQRLLDADARAPFVLAEGPVLRARLLRLEAEDHVLSLVIHHVATDLWSGGVLLRELAALYDAFRAGRPSPLAELPIQYADFAAWQRGWLRGDALERQMEYWRRRLAGAPAVLELPADRPRPPVQDLSGTLLPFALPADAVAFARALARREGATLFMVLMAAFQALLHRWTGEDDLVVGSPIANRTRPELEGLIGFFDNTLALRGDLSGDPTFAGLLRRVRETTLEAYAHQDVPFEKLVDELKVPRSVSHTPVFQVMLTLQNAPDTDIQDRLGEARLRPRVVETATARFDLTLILAEGDEGGLSGWAEYATALFDEATIRRLTRHLGTLLREAASAPHLPVSTLSLLSAAERGQVVRAFNATDRPRAAETVHALVAAQAARTPDAVAVEHGGERVTYAELEARANRLARRLRRLGVGPDARVAVAMERSIDLVVATYATLKAGGCCVAVDPGYPPERVAYMLADSRAAVVVTTTGVAARLPGIGAAVVRVDAEREAIAAEPADDPGVAVDPENLLYVLYTSGSTGRPKGAALPHRALANLIRWQMERWEAGAGADEAGVRAAGPAGRGLPRPYAGIGAHDVAVRGDGTVGARHASSVPASARTSGTGYDPAAAAMGDGADANPERATGPAARTLQFASLSFDVSFQEIYTTWASGGTLVLIDDDTRRDGEALLRHLRQERVERLFLPFAALQNLAETAEAGDAHLPHLREVITAGEALRSTPQLRAFFRANPQAVLENQYGPSETHVVSAQRVAGDPAAWPALPPIGAPVDNTRLYVLDARQQPAPLGVPGELYAGGTNVARGYLGRPALTAEKFVPDPFGPAGSRLYRTGDRARWREAREEVRECVSAEVREQRSAPASAQNQRTHALTHSRTCVLEYIGRTDFQVKLRGFRVEPGEIEAALAEHPSVAQAAVAVRGEGAARRLAAYVVPAAGAAPDAGELRAHLAAHLPDYMVPSAWRVMEALPLTPSGKVDRRSLPDPAPERPADATPRSATERAVAKVWAEVLEVEAVGVDDNFFDIGGHSLLLTRVRERLRQAMETEVSVIDLFQFSTVRALAAHLDRGRADTGAPKHDTAAAHTGHDRAALRREMLRRARR